MLFIKHKEKNYSILVRKRILRINKLFLFDYLLIGSPVLDVSGFYRLELARAISDIRQDFEILFQSQANELEEYYRTKTEQVREEIEAENERKRLLANQGAIDLMDTTALSTSIKDNQDDLLALQTENKRLSLKSILNSF